MIKKYGWFKMKHGLKEHSEQRRNALGTFQDFYFN